MSISTTVVYSIHLLVAGLWAGGVAFATAAVLPAARRGDLKPASLAFATGRLTLLSRSGAVVMLLTGGHMAATAYTGDSLLNTTNGNLVLAMVVLWLALTALVEVGASRIRDGTDADKLREPARAARPFFLAASAVGVLLLLIGGVLA